MKNTFFPFLIFFILSSCQQPASNATNEIDQKVNKEAFETALETHLAAVSNKDLVGLGASLSPKGDMYLLLPQSKLMTTVKEFMDFHRAWFAEPAPWTFETKILHSEVSDDFGIALVESMYKEPERDGKPYFNKMHISYALRKMNGKWYVIKDHACSIEKSTDIDAR